MMEGSDSAQNVPENAPNLHFDAQGTGLVRGRGPRTPRRASPSLNAALGRALSNYKTRAGDDLNVNAAPQANKLINSTESFDREPPSTLDTTPIQRPRQAFVSPRVAGNVGASEERRPSVSRRPKVASFEDALGHAIGIRPDTEVENTPNRDEPLSSLEVRQPEKQYESSWADDENTRTPAQNTRYPLASPRVTSYAATPEDGGRPSVVRRHRIPSLEDALGNAIGSERPNAAAENNSPNPEKLAGKREWARAEEEEEEAQAPPQLSRYPLASPRVTSYPQNEEQRRVSVTRRARTPTLEDALGHALGTKASGSNEGTGGVSAPVIRRTEPVVQAKSAEPGVSPAQAATENVSLAQNIQTVQNQGVRNAPPAAVSPTNGRRVSATRRSRTPSLEDALGHALGLEAEQIKRTDNNSGLNDTRKKDKTPPLVAVMDEGAPRTASAQRRQSPTLQSALGNALDSYHPQALIRTDNKEAPEQELKKGKPDSYPLINEPRSSTPTIIKLAAKEPDPEAPEAAENEVRLPVSRQGWNNATPPPKRRDVVPPSLENQAIQNRSSKKEQNRLIPETIAPHRGSKSREQSPPPQPLKPTNEQLPSAKHSPPPQPLRQTAEQLPQPLLHTVEQPPMILQHTVEVPPQPFQQTVTQAPRAFRQTAEQSPRSLQQTVEKPPQHLQQTVEQPPQPLLQTVVQPQQPLRQTVVLPQQTLRQTVVQPQQTLRQTAEQPPVAKKSPPPQPLRQTAAKAPAVKNLLFPGAAPETKTKKEIVPRKDTVQRPYVNDKNSTTPSAKPVKEEKLPIPPRKNSVPKESSTIDAMRKPVENTPEKPREIAVKKGISTEEKSASAPVKVSTVKSTPSGEVKPAKTNPQPRKGFTNVVHPPRKVNPPPKQSIPPESNAKAPQTPPQEAVKPKENIPQPKQEEIQPLRKNSPKPAGKRLYENYVKKDFSEQSCSLDSRMSYSGRDGGNVISPRARALNNTTPHLDWRSIPCGGLRVTRNDPKPIAARYHRQNNVSKGRWAGAQSGAWDRRQPSRSRSRPAVE